MSEDNSEWELEPRHRSNQVYVEERESINLEQALLVPPTLDDILNEEVEGFAHLTDSDLPDHRVATETPPQVKYKAKQALRKSLQAEVAEGVALIAENFRANNPEGADLEYHLNGRVQQTKFQKVNYMRAFRCMLDCMLDEVVSYPTLKAILEDVKHQTGIEELNANIWRLPLKRQAITALNSRCNARGLTLNLNKAKTMSDVRQIVEVFRKGTVSEIATKAKFFKDAVVINGKQYSIERHKVGTQVYSRIRVMVDGKRQPVRVDALKVLLNS